MKTATSFKRRIDSLPAVVLPSGTGRQIQFTSVTGSVSFNIDAVPPQDIYRGQDNGPDGGGVFWQDAKPGNPWPDAYTTDGTAPPRLDFSSTSTSVPGGRSFTTLSPLTDQLFYVGDGLTGEGVGSRQTFLVPDEATHLYLGLIDLGLIDGSRFIHGPDFYDNNSGSFSVQGVVVPEPAAGIMAMIGGIAGVGALRRRRPSR